MDSSLTPSSPLVFDSPSTPMFQPPLLTAAVADLAYRLFERAAGHVGLDFLAHPFWDKYLEYEERQEAQDKIFAILSRVIHIPMHQYARYFERLRQLSHNRPVTELVSAEVLAQYQSEVETESLQFGIQKTDLELERDIRAKIDAMFYQTFQTTQTETTKRWTYESEIKRPYFHVTELEHPQLANWRKYLDFEESESDYNRIAFLYERCLVTCAFYDEFWFRYARWMSAQEGKEEEVRNVYLRAATMYVPISRPGIRLQFAYFEEACGRIDIARDIHAAILTQLPDSVEVITSWADLERRQSGLESAIDVLKVQIDSPLIDIYTKAALVTQWAFLLWKVKGSVDEARTVFTKNVQWYADSRHFWQKWLEFELEQPTDATQEIQRGNRIKNAFMEMRTKSRLSAAIKQELGQVYLNYLQQRGSKDAMKEFMAVDRELFGYACLAFCHDSYDINTNNACRPQSISTVVGKSKLGAKENGIPLGELDDATRLKAESRFFSYYQLHMDPDPNAQGPANFH